jgi:hypothetical protein
VRLVAPAWARCLTWYLAGFGGLVAAAGPAAAPVPQDDRVADPGRDGRGVSDVQRQAGPGQPGPQLPGPQERRQPARGPDSRSAALPMMACWIASWDMSLSCFRLARSGSSWVSGSAPVWTGSCRDWQQAPCPGQLEAEPDQVIQRAQVHLAGDDGGDGRVAGGGPGGVAVQPGTAVAAGAVGGCGAAGSPPDPQFGDPLDLQPRPLLGRPQLGQRDVHPHLHRLPSPLRQQVTSGQAAHASAVILHRDFGHATSVRPND